MSCDLIIVGAGIIGLSAAWRCARAGLSVCVLDRGEPGRVSSWAAAGMLAPFAEVQFGDTESLEFGRRSLDLWPDFAAELEAASGMGVAHDPTGTLVVALDRDERAALRRLFEYQRELRLPVEWLESDALVEREPLLSPRVVGGILTSFDQQVDNRLVVEALLRVVRSLGVEVRANTEVARWTRDGDRATGVELTTGEVLRAPRVLVAAGAWSNTLGVDERLPAIRPVKGQAIALASPDVRLGSLRHVVRARWRGLGGYVVPRRSGRWLVGATSEDRGFDARVTAGGLLELLRFAFELLPVSAELEVLEQWAGFRPTAPTHLPAVGAGRLQGLYVAAGHYRHGILMAPLTAQLIADAVAADAGLGRHT